MALEPSLVNHQGLIGFFHDYLRLACAIGISPHLSSSRQRIVAWLTISRPRLNQRKVEELPWQLARLANWEQCTTVLADLASLSCLARRPVRRAILLVADEYHTPPWASLRMVDAYRQALDHPERQSADHLSHLAGLLINMGHHREALALRES